MDPERRLGECIAGKFRLDRLLGAGGMGAVYAATHVITRREVALKVLHAGYASSPDAAARFVREAQATSLIGHPGIVEVLDAGSAEDGTLYLALELLKGEDFEHALEERHVESADAVAIALDVLDVLAKAHARGIVHRDIKPENVFLSTLPDGTRRTRVLDFGIAKKLQPSAQSVSVTRSGSLLGTPSYMSPEQARGHQVDARTDLWAVGAMLFRAFAGRPPFEAENYNLLIVEIITSRPPSLAALRPDLADDLVRVVDRALSPLEDRWRSADEMAAALRGCHVTAVPLAPAVAASFATDPTLAARSSVDREAATLAPAAESMRASIEPEHEARPVPTATVASTATLDGVSRHEAPTKRGASRIVALVAVLGLASVAGAAWMIRGTSSRPTAGPTVAPASSAPRPIAETTGATLPSVTPAAVLPTVVAATPDAPVPVVANAPQPAAVAPRAPIRAAAAARSARTVATQTQAAEAPATADAGPPATGTSAPRYAPTRDFR